MARRPNEAWTAGFNTYLHTANGRRGLIERDDLLRETAGDAFQFGGGELARTAAQLTPPFAPPEGRLVRRTSSSST